MNSPIEISGSSGVAATPRPPPRSSVRSCQPLSWRARAAKEAIHSTVVRAAPRSRSCEPMWTWRPTIPGSRRSASSASSGVSPNLEPMMAGADLLVGVGLDSGRDPDQGVAHAGGSRAVDLLERVEHDECAGGCRRGELLVGLVVAVDDHALARDPGRLGEPELAERGDVGADPLLEEDPHHGDVRERLRAVDDDCCGRGLAVGAGCGAERLGVVHDERAAVLADELGRGDPAEREHAAVDARGIREERVHGPILPVEKTLRFRHGHVTGSSLA